MHERPTPKDVVRVGPQRFGRHNTHHLVVNAQRETSGADQVDRSLFGEQLHLPSKTLGMHHVVGIQASNKVTARRIHDLVESSREPPLFSVRQNVDPRISHASRELEGIVVRTVVDEKELPIRECLREDRPNSVGKRITVVMKRKSNRDGGHLYWLEKRARSRSGASCEIFIRTKRSQSSTLRLALSQSKVEKNRSAAALTT